MNRCQVNIEFADHAAAINAQAALEPDNEGHLESTVNDTTLELTASASTPAGLLRSVDDVLGCLRALGIE